MAAELSREWWWLRPGGRVLGGKFKSGVADRGASIRIPRHVSTKGSGYLEDRRPGANANPYEVASRLLKTICAID